MANRTGLSGLWIHCNRFLGLVACSLAAACASGFSQTNDISLAQTYPLEILQTLLLPRQDWQPYPAIQDRAAWQKLPQETQQILLRLGEEALSDPLPDLPATLYLEFARNGNRSRFEARHKARRQKLHHLTLAECLENQGRFLDALGNTAWAICEESSWCYPAHIGTQKAGRGLPDIDEPIVDLFAAETAVSLSWTLYLLGPELDSFSPLLRPRLQQEIDRRILAPFLERNDFGWMAFYEISRTRRPNNWNPWINASVLTASLIVEPDPARRVRLVHKVLRSLDRFLLAHPADGSCDEGPGYWGHAGGSLLDSLDLLHTATASRLDVFDHPLIQEIGRFIYRAHICDDWFVPVGDCSAQFPIYQDLVYRYGKRIRDPNLTAMAASQATVSSLLDSAGDRYFGRLLPALFDTEEILALRPPGPPLLRDVWLDSPDMQLMAARDQAGVCRGFYVAAWGGHNGQSHNHNDVGNFLVFADGRPVLVDVGVTTYTAKTFSNARYEIWVMQSAYHNLPTINGQMQRPGSAAAARQVHHQTTDNFSQLRLDLAPAYPREAQVDSWIRTVRLDRHKQVSIQDAFHLLQTTGPTTQNLITPLQVEIQDSDTLILRNPDDKEFAPLRLSLEGARFTPSIEQIDLDDDRLTRVWGHHLNRIILRPDLPSLQGAWTMRLHR